MFDAIVNGFTYLFSLSISSLLVHERNTTGFCVLVFYPTTLPNSVISSNRFFGLFVWLCVCVCVCVCVHGLSSLLFSFSLDAMGKTRKPLPQTSAFC